MEESKLKGFTPVMKNNVHDTFANERGKYWKFTVEFENGDKGGCMSSKETPSWKIGENYYYEKKVNGNFVNISSMKKVDGFVPGGSEGNPLHSMRLTALEQSMMINFDRNSTINAFEVYLLDRSKSNKAMVVQACLKRAVQLHLIEPFNTVDDLLSKSDSFINWVIRK